MEPMVRPLAAGSRLDRRKQRTVAAILEAAERRFLSAGYDATRVDEIAADADVAVGSIYNHFGSKEGLYAALLERALEVFETYMGEEAPEGLSELERVLDVLGRLARLGRERPGEMRILCLPQPNTPHEQLLEVVGRVSKAMADHERRTAALIEAAHRRGHTPPVAPRDAAAFLWSAWKGALVLSPRADRAAPGDDRDLRLLIEAGLRIVVGGLASESARTEDETVRAILESAPPARSRAAKRESRSVEVRRAGVAGELRASFPELALWTTTIDGGARRSSAGVRRRLEEAAPRLTAAAAIGARGESLPWAYRVFARRLGSDPDDLRDPVELAALHRGPNATPESSGLPGDALLIAAGQTGVPVYAFDADELDGDLWLRAARAGETLGRSRRTIGEGRPVIADTTRAVAEPFGASATLAPVTADTQRTALVALQAKGIAEASVEEVLWIVVEIMRAAR